MDNRLGSGSLGRIHRQSMVSRSVLCVSLYLRKETGGTAGSCCQKERAGTYRTHNGCLPVKLLSS